MGLHNLERHHHAVNYEWIPNGEVLRYDILAIVCEVVEVHQCLNLELALPVLYGCCLRVVDNGID